MDTFTTQLLYLRLREHCRRGDRKIVKSLRTRKSEIVSLKNDREASSMTASTIGLPNQDLDKDTITSHANMEGGNLMGPRPRQRATGN